MAEGALPYRDYFFEYPPLSIPAVGLPHAFGGDLAGYRDAFFALFGAIAAATAVAVLLAGRAAGLSEATQLAAGGLVALAPLMLGHELAPSRLELLAILLVALATLASARRRDGWAGALAGLGAAVKLWPVVMLVPLAALAFRRGGRPALTRSATAFAAGLCLPFAVALAVSPGGVADSLRFQSDRPLQVEAVGASALLMLRQLGVGGIDSEGSFESRSVNLVGDGADVVAALSTVLGLGAVIALLAIGARRLLDTRDDADAFATAMLTALAATAAGLAFAKVLSPQFTLWLLPLPLLVGGRLRWLAGASVAAILLLTNAAFARVDAYQNEYDLGATAIYAARGLAIVALAALLAFALWRRPAS
jgi:Glycosyltransferase family 87